MSIVKGRSAGSDGGLASMTAESSIPTRVATVFAVWAFLLTLLSIQRGSLFMRISSDYMVLALEAIVPAFLLTRLGYRWSKIDSIIAACLLAFMAWGAGLYFWPLPPYGLHLAHRGYLYSTRERLSYGVYVIFYITVWLAGRCLSRLVSRATGTAGPSRSSPIMTGLITGGTIAVGLSIWVATINTTIDRKLWTILLGMMLGVFVGLLALSFASAIGFGIRRSSASRRARITLIASWIGLVALWGAAIGVRFVSPQPSPFFGPLRYGDARPAEPGSWRAVDPPRPNDNGPPAPGRP